jgi:hypothetical protein
MMRPIMQLRQSSSSTKRLKWGMQNTSVSLRKEDKGVELVWQLKVFSKASNERQLKRKSVS